MDMLDLKFDDRQFDVVLDKGAMDALVVSARVFIRSPASTGASVALVSDTDLVTIWNAGG